MGLAALAASTTALSHGGLRAHRRHYYRLHILVGLSACLLMLSADDCPDARSRAILGIMTGVGFLGAGHILQAPGSQTELLQSVGPWIDQCLNCLVYCSGRSGHCHIKSHDCGSNTTIGGAYLSFPWQSNF